MSISSSIKSSLPKLLPKLALITSVVAPNCLQQKIISLGVNQVLSEQLTDGELDFLEGNYLQIVISDINKSWFFTVVDEQVVVIDQVEQSDVKISGELNAFIQLASQTVDPDTLFFKRQLLIEGNTELGLAIKNLLDCVELSKFPEFLVKPIQNYANIIA